MVVVIDPELPPISIISTFVGVCETKGVVFGPCLGGYVTFIQALFAGQQGGRKHMI